MIPVPPPPKPVPPPSSAPPSPRQPGRGFLFTLFLTALVWISLSRWLSSSSATGICERLNLPAAEPTVAALFWAFLLVIGFAMLQVVRRQSTSVRDLLSLPRRPTAGREWGLGATAGWACALAVVLVLAGRGDLRMQVSGSGHDLLLSLVSLLGLALLAFAEETAFRGYPFRLLREVAGSATATLAMSVLFGLASVANPYATRVSVVVTMLLGLVLSAGWLRTHALWLSAGFNFAFKAAAAVIFGLPVNGSSSFSYTVQSYTPGRGNWVGDYGLPASWITAVALLLALVAIVQLTRNYAWDYTHRPILAGGDPVDIAPPAAHAAMEAEAVSPAGTTLVQILPAPAVPNQAGSGFPDRAEIGVPRDDAS